MSMSKDGTRPLAGQMGDGAYDLGATPDNHAPHEALPLPTEILAIRAARDFCAANHMRGAAVAELDHYIARLQKVFLASHE